MSSGYDYSVDREAVAVLIQRTESEQRFLLDAFAAIARHPSARGDYSFVGDHGRENQVLDLGGFLVTFWVDDAVRTLRILEVEPV